MPGRARQQHSAVSCAKMAEPFRLRTRMGKKNHRFSRIRLWWRQVIIIIIIITEQGDLRLAPTSPAQAKIQLKLKLKNNELS